MIRRNDAGYELSDDPARLDLDTVTGFLATAYWSSHRPRATIERAIAHSLSVGLYAPDSTQAGFARAVSDHAAFGYLADVFVLPEHRGRGLARFMVAALLEHPDLAGVERWILATADAHGVYAALGFEPLPDPGLFMVRQSTTSPGR
ncbi:MAG TPA: GNAT family N-acetyltransferase [Jiangellaceae bacterium]